MTDQKGIKQIGIVLSGATTRSFRFLVLEDAEELVREGKYVVAKNPRSGISYVAIIEGLTHFHEFYEEGDVWVQALRKGKLPPGQIARQFLLSQARIVGVVEKGSIYPAPRPPKPGTPVYQVTGSDLVPVYGHDPGDIRGLPPHLLSIGHLLGYESGDTQLHALINLKAMTMHFAIFGTTGSGKSNTMGVIIEELGKRPKNDLGIAKVMGGVPALIIDINDDYIDYYKNPDLVPRYERVRLVVFNDSPALESEELEPTDVKQELVPLTIDLDALTAAELAEAITVLYRRGPSESSSLQESYLISKLDREELNKVFSDYKISYNELFSNPAYFRMFIESIEEDIKNKAVHQATGGAVLRQLREFFDTMRRYGLITRPPGSATIDYTFIDEVTDPAAPSLSIFLFSSTGASGVPLHVKQFIVYYLAKLLFNRFVYYKKEEASKRGFRRVAMFVLEEAQNFAPNLAQYQIGYSLARSVLATIATQGRKFGLCLAIVTQRPKYVDPVVLSMMNTFFIHRVAPTDVKFVEQVTGGIPPGLKQNLSTMERGISIIVGQMNPSPLPTVARIRRRKSHEAG